MTKKFLVFSGNSNLPLAAKICRYLNIPLGKAEVKRFPDGEVDVKVLEDVRGADVFVVQSNCNPVNDHLMELLIMTDCLKRASAERITLCISYFGYARQDRKAEGRVPITAKLVSNLLTVSGANRILTVDLHAAQIQGFFDIPLDHLYAGPVMVDHIRRLAIHNLALVSPDIGGVKMARAYARRLNCPMAIVDKRRISATDTEVMNMIGTVEGMNVLIVDDIISTGNSICEAANACRKHGAKDIYVYATHAVFAGDCVNKLKKAGLKKIITTDTIPLPDSKLRELPNLEVVTVANMIGEAIARIHKSESISELFV